MRIYQKGITPIVLSKNIIPETNEKLDATISLKTNGKSFYWASQFLGREMAENAAKLYAFCRVLDDMADGDIKDGPERLRHMQKKLTQKTGVSDPVLEEILPFFDELNLPKRAVIDLIEGLLQDQKYVLLKSEAELIQYSYHVAGTVGWMMCSVLKCENKDAFSFALDLGIAMQLTNVARDVYEDARMGRRYLPSNWVDNLSPSQIIEAAKDPKSKKANLIKRAILKLLDLSDTYYNSGVKGLVFLPWKANLAIAIAAFVYRQIGIQLRRNQVNWYEGRTVTSNFVKFQSSCAALPFLFTRFKTLPKHDVKLHQPLAEKLDSL